MGNILEQPQFRTRAHFKRYQEFARKINEVVNYHDIVYSCCGETKGMRIVII